MSAYILILCMKLLSNYINHQVDTLLWERISIQPIGPHFSHLFVTGDLTRISSGNQHSVHTVYKSMSFFCDLSGPKINAAKSKSMLSKLWDVDSRSSVHPLFNITSTTSFNKYLDFPILNRKAKSDDFQYIIDHTRKKLAS